MIQQESEAKSLHREAIQFILGSNKKKKDPLHALELWKQSSDKGLATASLDLALSCEKERRFSESRSWLLKTASQIENLDDDYVHKGFHQTSQNNVQMKVLVWSRLGSYFYTGEGGIPCDYKGSEEWLLKAVGERDKAQIEMDHESHRRIRNSFLLLAKAVKKLGSLDTNQLKKADLWSLEAKKMKRRLSQQTVRRLQMIKPNPIEEKPSMPASLRKYSAPHLTNNPKHDLIPAALSNQMPRQTEHNPKSTASSLLRFAGFAGFASRTQSPPKKFPSEADMATSIQEVTLHPQEREARSVHDEAVHHLLGSGKRRKDMETALELLQKSSGMGLAAATLDLALLLEKQGRFAEALSSFRTSYEQVKNRPDNDVHQGFHQTVQKNIQIKLMACSRLGRYFYEGLGMESPEYETAQQWLLKVVADKDNSIIHEDDRSRRRIARSMTLLGKIAIKTAKGDPVRFASAEQWIHEASRINHAEVKGDIEELKKRLADPNKKSRFSLPTKVPVSSTRIAESMRHLRIRLRHLNRSVLLPLKSRLQWIYLPAVVLGFFLFFYPVRLLYVKKARENPAVSISNRLPSLHLGFGKIPQQIVFPKIQPPQHPGSYPLPPIKTTAGLPVTIAIGAGPASIQDGNLVISGAGIVELIFIQEGDKTYAPIPLTRFKLPITP
jgi:TPR repeat protein